MLEYVISYLYNFSFHPGYLRYGCVICMYLKPVAWLFPTLASSSVFTGRVSGHTRLINLRINKHYYE